MRLIRMRDSLLTLFCPKILFVPFFMIKILHWSCMNLLVWMLIVKVRRFVLA
jgi:hypothetical protein